MNHQLALAIQLNYQASLEDFCWGANTSLQQQLEKMLTKGQDRFIYLWGPSGSGKSHLLQGVCQEMSQLGPSSYLPLSLLKEWGSECLDGFEHHTLVAIDDIESIAGNRAWEEALFHLFNRIRDNQETILLIAGKFSPTTSPIKLPDLRSRLSWGLVYHIAELQDEEKVMVLQQQAKKRGFVLSSSVALFLIKRCSRHMHSLNQILEQLDSASLAAQRKITIPFIKSILNI